MIPSSPGAFDVAGRVVLVTGGSKGIGAGIAEAFAMAGARVVLCSRHVEEGKAKAAEIVKKTEAAGKTASVSAFHCDVTQVEDVRKALGHCIELHGKLDALCLNAGIFPQTRLAEMEEEEFTRVLDTNLKSAFLFVREGIRGYLGKGLRRFVLTSSITGPRTGHPGWAHYGASKAGQEGFMRSAAVELAKHGATINCVAPGNIFTEGLADLGKEYLATMEAEIPLGHLGSVADVGNAALFLASDASAFITGQTITVDGGQTLTETSGFRSDW